MPPAPRGCDFVGAKAGAFCERHVCEALQLLVEVLDDVDLRGCAGVARGRLHHHESLAVGGDVVISVEDAVRAYHVARFKYRIWLPGSTRFDLY